MSVVVFVDAGRTSEYAQLSVLAGIPVGTLQKGSLFYTTSWSSDKSRRPLKATTAAEILAVGAHIDEGKTNRDIFNMIIGKSFDFKILTDSKYLSTSLSTKRNSINRSLLTDENIEM